MSYPGYHDQAYYAPPPAPAGFRSLDDRKRLTSRAWVVGIFSVILQVVIPIGVLIAGFATIMSACSAAISGPEVHAGGAVAHDGRVWFTVNAPLEDADAKGRRLLLYSAGPDDSEPRLEEELLAGEMLSMFSGDARLLMNEGRPLVFSSEGVFPPGGELIDKPEGAWGTQTRPFLLDGSPAIGMARTEGVDIFKLEDGAWSAAGTFAPEMPEGADLDTLLMVDRGGQRSAYVTGYDGQLWRLAEGAPPAKLASDARDVALLPAGSDAVLAYLTVGPGLDELLDDLEDPDAADDPNRPKVMLKLLDASGSTLTEVEAKGARELSAVVIGSETFIATDHHGVMRLFPIEGATIGEAREIGAGGTDKHVLALIGLVFLWFFGGNLVSLVAAALMGSAMSASRTPEEVATYASLGQRAIALFVDTALIGGLVFAAISAGTSDAPVAELTGAGVGLVFLVMEGLFGATPGKLLVGIRVRRINADGGPSDDAPGLRSVMRALGMAFDSLFGGLIGIMIVAFHPKWQRVGDQIAGTVVIRRSRVGQRALDLVGHGR